MNNNPARTQKSSPLSLNDHAFVKEYARTRNQTRSYMATHPKASYYSAAQSAHDKLKKPQFQAAIKKELGWELDDLQAELSEHFTTAKQTNNLKEWRLGVMDLAELAGFRQRRESPTPTNVVVFVGEGLLPRPSTIREAIESTP